MGATLVNISSTSLDKGMFIVPFWWADSESSWQEMVKLAQADGGRVFFDKSGTLVYQNMHHWAYPSNQTLRHTFNVSNWRALRPYVNPEDVWDGVICEYSPLEESYQQVIYQSSGEPLSIPPSQTKTFTATYQRPVTSLITPVGGAITITNGLAATTDNRDFLVTTAGGEDMTSSCTVALTNYAQRSEVSITNANAVYTGYLVKFQLRGTPLTGAPLAEAQYNSNNSPVSFPRVKEIRGNELIQSLAQADTIALFLRDRLENPRILYKLSNVPAIPYLELGDRVTVVGAVDGNASFWSRTGYIVEIGWRYSTQTGYVSDYTIMDDNNLFRYTDPFIWGTTVYGHGDLYVGTGRLLY